MKNLKEMVSYLIENGNLDTRKDIARTCPMSLLKEIWYIEDDISVLKEVVNRADKGLLFTILNCETDPRILSLVAERGYGLATLYRHRDPMIRKGVAKGISKDNLLERRILDSLLNDISPEVRAAALEKSFAMFGKKISVYAEDESLEVREVYENFKVS